MPAACGLACEVCGFTEACGGRCFEGTNPKSPGRFEQLRKDFGFSCAVLECAIRKKVDYCLKCDEFPCEVHYHVLFPYSRNILDFYKNNKDKQTK